MVLESDVQYDTMIFLQLAFIKNNDKYNIVPFMQFRKFSTEMSIFWA